MNTFSAHPSEVSEVQHACANSKHKPQKQQKLAPLQFCEGASFIKSHFRQQKRGSLPAKKFTSPLHQTEVACILSKSWVFPNATEFFTTPQKTSGTIDKSHSCTLVMKPFILGCPCALYDCWSRTRQVCILCQATQPLPRKTFSSPEVILNKN